MHTCRSTSQGFKRQIVTDRQTVMTIKNPKTIKDLQNLKTDKNPLFYRPINIKKKEFEDKLMPNKEARKSKALKIKTLDMNTYYKRSFDAEMELSKEVNLMKFFRHKFNFSLALLKV